MIYKKTFLIISFLAFFALAGSVNAATGYLRVNGSDANCNGTADVDDSVPVRPACANATFNGAAADASSGDTIQVQSGTYTTAISLTATSWGGKTLTFTGNSASHPLVSVNTANGAIGLPASGSAMTGTTTLNYIDFTNTNNRIILFNDVSSTSTLKVNNSVWDSGTANATLFIGAAKSWAFEGTYITWSSSAMYFFAAQSMDHVIIDHSNITTTGVSGANPIDFTYSNVAGQAYSVTTPSKITNNTFLAPNFKTTAIVNGIYLDGGTFVVSNNTFGSASSPVLSAAVRLNSLVDTNDSYPMFVVVEKNTIYGSSATGASLADGYIQVGSSADAAPDTDTDTNLNLIRGTVVDGNKLYLNSGNLATNAVGIKIGPEVRNRGIVSANQIEMRSTLDIPLYIHNTQNVLYIGNSIWGRSGITFVAGTNNVVANNTSYQNSGAASISAPLIIRDSNDGTVDAGSNIMYGNLLVADGTTTHPMEYAAHSGTIDITDMWYRNYVYRNADASLIMRDLTDYETRGDLDAYWQTLTSASRLNDSTLYSDSDLALVDGADPQFVTKTDAILRLGASSPAKGTKNPSSPNLSIWNDKGAWQIWVPQATPRSPVNRSGVRY